jgi:hypothetical protein
VIGPRNVRPDELGDAEGAELHDALVAGNRLADSMDDAPVQPSLAFADRVMAAVEREPTPGATGFLVPLRRRGLVGGFRDSVRQALASIGTGRPMVARSAALAYVLVVALVGASLTGAAALGAGTALGLLNPSTSPTPPPAPTVQPTPAPPMVAPSPTPDVPDASVAPSPSPTETHENPDATDDHGGNSGPGGGGDDDGSGPEQSDDHGGNPGPGGGGDDDDSSGPGPDGSGGSGGSGDDDSSGPGSGREV